MIQVKSPGINLWVTLSKQVFACIPMAAVHTNTSSVRVRFGLVRMLEMLNIKAIIVSKMTSCCAGTVQMREESESGIRKREEM